MILSFRFEGFLCSKSTMDFCRCRGAYENIKILQQYNLAHYNSSKYVVNVFLGFYNEFNLRWRLWKYFHMIFAWLTFVCIVIILLWIICRQFTLVHNPRLWLFGHRDNGNQGLISSVDCQIEVGKESNTYI